MMNFERGALIHELHDAFEMSWAVPTDEATAHDIVDFLLRLVIAQLRADPNTPVRGTLDWEWYFANIAARTAEEISWLNGLVDQRDAVRAIADHLTEMRSLPSKQSAEATS